MNDNYKTEEYIDGYLNGLKTAKALNKTGEWVFLAVGVFFGLIGAFLLTIVT